MAMRMSMIAAITCTIATFMLTGSERQVEAETTKLLHSFSKVTEAHEVKSKAEIVTCHANGNSNDAVGMSVTWGVPKNKCIKLCGPTINNGQGFTYEQQFIAAISVTFDKKCQCSAGGRVIVNFWPQDKAQTHKCAEGTSDEIHKMCWKMYMKARGTRFKHHGAIKVPRYSAPFTPSDFVVKRGCRDPCDAGSCKQITMPGALHGMGEEDKAHIGFAIKKVMDGNKTDVSDVMKELIAILPPDDLDAAEFAASDEDGDGQLSVDELDDFYVGFDKEQIAEFVKEVDENENGDIDPDEFHAFKEVMRDFNPAVDLLTGAAVEVIFDDGEVNEAKAEWKAVTVECMKNGKPAPGECEGTKDEALEHFDKKC